MIKLSERLLKIANYISNEEDIADIGTDHGYLPLYLMEKNENRKAVFTDVNDGPLKKAENIIKREHPQMSLSKFDIRKGDGLQPLQPGEVDTVIMAGMGGVLIKEILEVDIAKTKSFKKLILQPRNGSHKLRKWLIANDFYISDEELAHEKKRICEIILVEPGSDKKNQEFKNDLDYEFSPILAYKPTAIAGEWVDRLLKTERAIEESIITGGSGQSQKKLIETGKRIEYLESLTRKPFEQNAGRQEGY